jgi:hypothetical protein
VKSHDGLALNFFENLRSGDEDLIVQCSERKKKSFQQETTNQQHNEHSTRFLTFNHISDCEPCPQLLEQNFHEMSKNSESL